MKYAASFVLALLSVFLALPVQAAGNGFVRTSAGGALIINNNNNNNAQRAAAANAGVRARRPVLRFLFPRAAARRDALFGRPVDRFGNVR
jgi:hypothetical protein